MCRTEVRVPRNRCCRGRHRSSKSQAPPRNLPRAASGLERTTLSRAHLEHRLRCETLAPRRKPPNDGVSRRPICTRFDTLSTELYPNCVHDCLRFEATVCHIPSLPEPPAEGPRAGVDRSTSGPNACSLARGARYRKAEREQQMSEPTSPHARGARPYGPLDGLLASERRPARDGVL